MTVDEGLQRTKLPKSVGFYPLFITFGNYSIQIASPFSVSHYTFTLIEPLSPFFLYILLMMLPFGCHCFVTCMHLHEISTLIGEALTALKPPSQCLKKPLQAAQNYRAVMFSTVQCIRDALSLSSIILLAFVERYMHKCISLACNWCNPSGLAGFVGTWTFKGVDQVA